MSLTYSGDSILLLALPLVPLLGALLVQLFGRFKPAISGWIAFFASTVAFLIALRLFPVISHGSVEAIAWRWFAVDSFEIPFSFRMDRLAAVMTLVVTGIGSVIHLFAIGYMAEDESRPRFFSYLNLFLFAMLVLVLADNALVMFIGWEGVGLCSYLLIGFWHRSMPNAVAGQKAFVVNRIGDAGFLLGMFLLLFFVGSLNFGDLAQGIGTLAEERPLVIEMAALLLFIGAIGKSAQFPLFVWLPDAMAGPTPVSALIHAATMVTAGIYMVTRFSFLYLSAPVAASVILIIGTLTAFIAATIALCQQDIKKVLAYSTVSQLGFMVMALGAMSYSFAIYHVITHAFFKACLFLCAGAVIHAMHHQQDMRSFGGLWRAMPFTFISYFAATIAIAGLPFTSGFYSKDKILYSVASMGGVEQGPAFNLYWVCWAVGAFTALLTAVYMTRSLVLTFFGRFRGEHLPKEVSPVMWIPLLILAVPSVVFAAFFGESLLDWLGPWTREDLALPYKQVAELPLYHELELLAITLAVGGFALALVLFSDLRFVPRFLKPDTLARSFKGLNRMLSMRWWLDEVYDFLVVKPLGFVSRVLAKFVDQLVIDGAVNLVANTCGLGSDSMAKVHSGKVGASIAFITLANLALLIYLIY